ncbi:TNF superfamily member 10 [Phyllostomus discolor]|uniref:Tumor necrosis factor ligand superfamily member n=1 Tax=Phyllostomus discolor TaxID=89673 RepID=A0A7E6D2W5_9CHIR|nr:tumor necrosis factor ligand superfamily member 10 [Phyllostomus discolor]KAF6122246.1 TNF superfamily member 10 [Phyllostomus discolor]
MAALQTSGNSSPGLNCLLIVIFIVLLQSVSVAVTYIYFTNELKQVQEKLSKSGIACLLKEDDGSWDPYDDDSINNPCWHIRWQLRQLVRKMVLRTYEETISTAPESQQDGPSLIRRRELQRVAAHITGGKQRRTTPPVPNSKNENVFGHKITSWEASRKGHSFLNNMHMRNGELIIDQTGFYYIYSQTYFRFQEPEDVSTVGHRRKNKQMVQYIYKFTTYNDPILLMKSARNSCWSKDSEYGLYSIYQGGIFELKENDKIFVSVTNQELMDMDQEASFFGAFLIG